MENLLTRTSGQHGFWLSNHIEIIEKELQEALNKYGLNMTVELVNKIDSPFVTGLYKKIEAVKELVYSQEFNEKHEDDYFNAGGFFGHWSTYTAEEKAELIGKAQ